MKLIQTPEHHPWLKFTADTLVAEGTPTPATRPSTRRASRLSSTTASAGGGRGTSSGNPIDATVTLPRGRRVEGMAGLRAWLLERPERFASTVTEKLLSYALGRGLSHADRPTVRAVVREAAADNYRWSALVAGIVKSPAFLIAEHGGGGLR